MDKDEKLVTLMVWILTLLSQYDSIWSLYQKLSIHFQQLL